MRINFAWKKKQNLSFFDSQPVLLREHAISAYYEYCLHSVRSLIFIVSVWQSLFSCYASLSIVKCCKSKLQIVYPVHDDWRAYIPGYFFIIESESIV